MSTQMQAAKDTLFGEEGLHASNFKMFPGNARDVSSEEVASELNSAFARMRAGEFTVLAKIGE